MPSYLHSEQEDGKVKMEFWKDSKAAAKISWHFKENKVKNICFEVEQIKRYVFSCFSLDRILKHDRELCKRWERMLSKKTGFSTQIGTHARHRYIKCTSFIKGGKGQKHRQHVGPVNQWNTCKRCHQTTITGQERLGTLVQWGSLGYS